MKKLLLFMSFMLILMSGFSQPLYSFVRCIVVDGDSVNLDVEYMETRNSSDALLPVEHYQYSKLNDMSTWTEHFEMFNYTGEIPDTLETDSLVYITFQDSLVARGDGENITVRQTWVNDSVEGWIVINTHVSVFTADMKPMYVDTDSTSFYFEYDPAGGLNRIRYTEYNYSRDEEYIVDTYYDFGSDGNIMTEKVVSGDSLIAKYDYEYDGMTIFKIVDHPEDGMKRWKIEDTFDSVRVEYQQYDSFFDRWDNLSQKTYFSCDYITGFGNQPISDETYSKEDIISVKYYNTLGQEISKPSYGFYIERIDTKKGVFTNKKYIQ